jgi:hypothetical protein
VLDVMAGKATVDQIAHRVASWYSGISDGGSTAITGGHMRSPGGDGRSRTWQTSQWSASVCDSIA